MVEVAAVIGVREDVRAALQFGVDAARGLELEGAGAGPGDGRAVDAVARQEVAGMPSLVGRLCDRLPATKSEFSSELLVKLARVIGG
jgi:hypothetical protein